MIGELFDPKAEFSIRECVKPHWSQAGAIVYITIRTHDSIPKRVIQLWERQRCDWLSRMGVLAADATDWKPAVAKLDEKERRRFQKHFNRLQETELDACHGACVLRRPELAKIVANSFLHFDRERYRMGDFVIMPNHAHMLVAFPTEESMKDQCTSWTRFTASQIHAALGTSGRFWQPDPFDHLVRSPEQYEYIRQYIKDNPSKANLSTGGFFYHRCDD